MPRGRKKGRGTARLSLAERHESRDINTELGPPTTKDQGMNQDFPMSPGKSFKERITDYFKPAIALDHNYVLNMDLNECIDQHGSLDHVIAGRDCEPSPPMPLLFPMTFPATQHISHRLLTTDSSYHPHFSVNNSPPKLSPGYPTELPPFLYDSDQIPTLLLEQPPFVAQPQKELRHEVQADLPFLYQDYQEQVLQLYQEYPHQQEYSELPHMQQEQLHHPPSYPPTELDCMNDVRDVQELQDANNVAEDRSEGDSGKENEAEDSVSWSGSRSSLGSRGSRPRSGHHASTSTARHHTTTNAPPKMGYLLKERIQEKASILGDNNSGRITRSKRSHNEGHEEPLSLLNCERLEPLDKSATPTPRSPPTPHKIKMPNKPISPANALQKLKLSSQGLFARTPKKGTSTKGGKLTKRLVSGQQETKPPASHTKAAKIASAADSSRKVTEYFPIRRSERKPKNEQLKEQMEGIEARLLATDDNGLDLEVVMLPDKGRGVVSTRDLKKGEFVVEYAGDIIDVATAKEREIKYSLDVNKGCYMYYFKHKGKNFCIDGTSESGRLGRLVNHSCKHPNMVTKVVELGQDPRLILLAKHDISPGCELLYDYGDRDKESLKAHPWLAS